MKNYSLILLFIFLFSCKVGEKVKNNNSPNYLGEETPDNIPKIFGKGIVSVEGRFDMGFAISPDGKSIAFGVADPDETCIYLVNYADGKWASPNKSFLPNNVNTFFPMFSPSGEQLYFAKATEDADTDLWFADYANGQATNLQSLDSLVNSKSREAGHGLAKNGTFYFTSNRDTIQACCGDIYYSKDFSSVQKVTKLSSNWDEESLFLSPNEDYIIVQAWKPEFEGKHDLYISYKTKNGTWTNPERMNAEINSKEIEQRPFVSPDNQFLFFNRMSLDQVDGKEVFESDLYWVSTQKIFKPYVYNSKIEANVKLNEPFQINFPPDLFKDINDEHFSYQVFMEDGSELPEWITFDASSFSLNGVWQTEETLIFKVSATDSAGNVGSISIWAWGRR